MNNNYQLNENQKEELKKWHGALDDNRGDRAQLRRCTRPAEVLLLPAFYKPYSILYPNGSSEHKLWAAAFIGLVSHIKEDTKDQESIAYKLGHPPKQTKKGEAKPTKAPLSIERFSKLLKSKSLDDLYTQLRRAIALIKHQADIISLAEALYQWDFEQRHRMKLSGESIQVHWASQYFSKASDKKMPKKKKKKAPAETPA